MIESKSEKVLRKEFGHMIGNDFAKQFQHPRWQNALVWYRDTITAVLEDQGLGRGNGGAE